MTLPVMEPDLDAATLEAWCRAIDEGPFTSLCFGERMAFDNPHALTLLGAVAAWTSRVEIVLTVIVPQLHRPVSLAKALATADVLKRVWRGERVAESVLPVGPLPVQPGGPPLLVGTMGPKTVRSAAAWADGLADVSMDLDLVAMSAVFDVAREQDIRHLHHYMNWLPTSLVGALAAGAGFAGTLPELKDLLRRLEDLGTEEFHLMPTGSDVSQVERVAKLLV